jgi:hypothetical protein
MTRKWLYLVAVLTFLGGAVAPSLNAEQNPGGAPAPFLNAQQNWPSPEEFRTAYLSFIDTLSARIPASDQSSWAVGLRQKISDIRQQVTDLSYPMLDQFSKITDRQAFTKMADGLAAGANNVEITDRLRTDAVLQPQGAISPPDYSGAVAGTTCSTTPTSAGTMDTEKIALYVDRGVSLIAEVACESIVVVLGEGTNIPFCVVWGIARGVEVVLDSLINHQEFCNSLLDGAKADATLADVIDIHGDVVALDTHLTNVNDQITGEFTALNTHLTNVDTHIANEFTTLDAHIVALFATLGTQVTSSTNLLSAKLNEVMKLELTPEGLRQIVPAILTCTVALNNCPNVLTKCNGPGGVCAWNEVGPLP